MMYLDFLVYGQAGVGKTTLMGSGVDDDRLWPTLMMDYEGGTIAIESVAQIVPLSDFISGNVEPEPGKIVVIRPTSLTDISNVYNWMSKNEHPYKAFVVDSLSEVNQLALMAATGNDKKAASVSMLDISMPQIKDYGNTATMVRTLVRALRNLPLHRFYVCGAKTGDNPQTKMTQLMPSMVGQLATDIPALVTVVGFLTTEEAVDGDGNSLPDIRVMYTNSSSRILAKDRSERGKLGGEIVDPTLPKIMDLLGYGHITDVTPNEENE